MTTDRAATDIDAVLASHLTEVAGREHVPAIAYGVVAGGRLAHAGGVGAIAGGSTSAPTPETPSRIASMTKSFTAAGILALRDEGALALDDPVDRYVPALASLRRPTTDAPPVSIRHLMSMAAGLPEDNRWADRHLDETRASTDALFGGGLTFARAPGVAYEYSNLGWAMLGRVIEAATGLRAQRYLTQRLIAPLGLHRTTWDRPEGSVMQGFTYRDDAWMDEGEPLPDGEFGPPGGLWSTVADVGVWIAFMMDAFPPRDGADALPLSRASRREMQQLHRAGTPTVDAATGRITSGGYGFGLVVLDDPRFGAIVRHGGGLPGFASQMLWLPDRGVGVVVLMNLTGVRTDLVALEMLELLDDEGLAGVPRTVALTPALSEAADAVIGLLLRGWDDAVADDLFADNVDLDDPRDRRSAEAGRLLAMQGPFEVRTILAQSATTAVITAHGSAGPLEITVRLSPAAPPRVQEIEVGSPDASTLGADAVGLDVSPAS